MTRGPGAPRPFAHYDRRGYETLDVERGYALWSRTYGELDDRFDVDLLGASPLLRERLPGSHVVDLACGNGRIGAWLRRAGAREVTGVDRTPQMLAGARARDAYAALSEADILATGLPDASFDGATCSMALCHVADLGAFFAEARRIVRPGGFLATVDFHPFFLMLGIPTHFESDGRPLAIDNHVHALRDFFREATSHGWTVRELEERFVDDEWATALPGYAKFLGYPITHLWVWDY